jgi:hypothetical protein
MRMLVPSRGLYLSLASLVLAAGAVGYAAWNAVVLDPLPVPAAPGGVVTIPDLVLAADASVQALNEAVDVDPFRPDRRRPAERFRLPEDRAAEAASAMEPADREPLLLIGTVVMPAGRSFAMCQLPGQAPRLVRVGETVGDLTLRFVEQGRAVFATSDGVTVEAMVPKAGS